MRKSISFLLLLICITVTGFAQQSVTGTVTDESRNPMEGVSVVVKNTAIATMTGKDGKYKLDVPATAKIIVFSFIGMTAQEIAIKDKSVINVQLVSASSELEDVVVIWL